MKVPPVVGVRSLFACFALCIGLVGSCTARHAPRPQAAPSTPQDQEFDRLRQEGMDAYGKQDYATVERVWKEGLAKAEAAGNRRRIAAFCANLGILYHSMSQYETAEGYLKRSQDTWRALGDDKQLALCLNNVGNLCKDLGRYPEAISAYQEAVNAWTKQSGDPITLAKLRIGLASTYNSIGQYEIASEQYGLAMKLIENNMDAQSLFVQAGLLNSWAGVYQARGDYVTAQAFCERALKTYDAMMDDEGRAAAHNNLGNIFMRQSDYNAALAHLGAAVTLFRTGAFGRLNLATGLSNMGNVEALQKHFDKALPLYKEALQIEIELKAAHSIAQAHYNIGSAQEELNDLPDALQSYQAALDAFLRLDVPQDVAYAYYSLGALRERMGDTDEAIKDFDKAQEYDKKISIQVNDPEAMGAFQKVHLGDTYPRSARLLLAKKRPSEALLRVEEGRAWGLSAQAARNQMDFSRLLSKIDANRLRQAEIAANAAHAHHQALVTRCEDASATARDKEVLKAAAADLAQAEVRLKTVREDLLARNPAYRQARYAPTPTFAQLQTLAAQNKDTLYLEWAAIDDKHLLLMALSQRDGLKTFSLALDRSGRKLADDWKAALTAPAEQDPLKRQAALKLAATEPQRSQALSDALLRPLTQAGLLQEHRYDRLVFVCDGWLQGLPFAAMKDASGARLAQRYALSSSVSLGLLVWPDNPRHPARTLLCAADPLGGTPGGSLLRGSRGQYGPLDGARREGERVAAMTPRSVIYKGRDAKKTAIQNGMERYAVLYFATHGILDARNGMRSALLLAPEKPTESTYATLEAREIATQPLSARLTVLSACETGLGQESAGEGLLGLVWAFQAAGCSSVVASQWSVDDARSKQIMIDFYDNLTRLHLRKDEALRRAMCKATLHPHATLHPYYWAGFQVYGNTRPLSFTP